MEMQEITDYPWRPENWDIDRTTGKKKKKTAKTNGHFIISTLDFEQDLWLDNKTASGISQTEQDMHTFNMGLKGGEGLTVNGKPMVWERDEKAEAIYPGGVRPWSNKTLSQIHKLDRTHMALQIRYGKQVNEDELKN